MSMCVLEGHVCNMCSVRGKHKREQMEAHTEDTQRDGDTRKVWQEEEARSDGRRRSTREPA